MVETHSAGGVVLSTNNRVLVVNQNQDSWSLPKGHVDPGEDALQAAVREIGEESGVKQLKFIKELGSYQRYQIGLDGLDNKDELKEIKMFLFTSEQVELKPEDSHNPEARWVEMDKVAALLTHPKDKAFFENILSDVKQYIALL